MRSARNGDITSAKLGDPLDYRKSYTVSFYQIQRVILVIFFKNVLLSFRRHSNSRIAYADVKLRFRLPVIYRYLSVIGSEFQSVVQQIYPYMFQKLLVSVVGKIEVLGNIQRDILFLHIF